MTRNPTRPAHDHHHDHHDHGGHGDALKASRRELPDSPATVDVNAIIGHRLEPALIEALHRLEHDGALETVTVATADLARRRLRATGDQGTEYRIALPRDRPLFDGAVLALGANRGAVLRVEGERWLRLHPPSPADALELGYCAGNLHWRVRFDTGDLLVALEAPRNAYLARIERATGTRRDRVRRRTDAMRALLTALQHADSLFPSGSFAFSQGLEASIAEAADLGPFELESFVACQIKHRWASADRVALIRSHRAGGDLGEIAALDREVEASTLVEGLRTGSKRNCSARLLTHRRMGTPDAEAYRHLIRAGEGHGHLSVMQGFLWHAVGLSESDAVAMSGYRLVAGLMAAAVRLGAIGALDAQAPAARLLGQVETAASAAVDADQGLSSWIPLAEIAIMHHGASGQRLFTN